ncbi:MAG: preprotein translocase subunit SecE [Candidatus Pacebacteria bacterium]|nr:preprotein translocase subunit SecE [Candidatus Paceibacterota bacterium]
MNIKQYLEEVISEIRRVSWPTKQRTIKDSLVVVVVSLGAAAFLGAADLLFTDLAKTILEK